MYQKIIIGAFLHLYAYMYKEIFKSNGVYCLNKRQILVISNSEKAKNVSTIFIRLDGTYVFLYKNEYRQAMVGTLTLYNKKGKWLHTIYIASELEYGKFKFKKENRF